MYPKNCSPRKHSASKKSFIALTYWTLFSEVSFRPGRFPTTIFMMGIFAVLLLGGCGKKVARLGAPFELDKVFSGIFSVRMEDSKDKGLRLAKEGNFDDAIDAFKHYVVEKPESFFGFNALAVCYKNVGDHSRAMKNYERALEFADSNQEKAKVLANIGNLYSAANKYQVALGFYKEAQSEFSRNPIYLILIARTFLFLDEDARARKVLSAAEDIHRELDKYEQGEDRGLGYYLLAQSYLALSDEQKVFEHLENAVKANPERFTHRIEQDISDEKSLFYTLRDDPRLRKALRRRSSRISSEVSYDWTIYPWPVAQLMRCSLLIITLDNFDFLVIIASEPFC